MKIIKVGNKVCIYYSFQGKVLRYASGIDWDKRNTTDNKKVITSYLGRLQEIVNKYKIEKGTNPSREFVKEELSKGLVKKKETLLEFYDEFYNSKLQDINVKPQSRKDYVSLKNALTDYELDKKKLVLTDLTLNFMIAFVRYLSNSRDGEQYLTKGKLNDNTIRKRLSFLKSFFRYLEANKIYEVPNDAKSYSVDSYKTPIVTLNDQELKALWEWDAGKYEKVRDIFVFACMTSLRYSDIITLRQEHITDNIITKTAHKSRKEKEKYVVPLNKISKQILEKYKYNLYHYESQPFNRELKEMAKASKLFDTDEVFTKYSGGQKIEVTEKKHKLISSHTARRSFITRCIVKGVPLNQLMAMSSHVKLDTLTKYIDKYAKNPVNYVKQLEI